jgi:cysteine-rich repeat protein
MFARSTPVSLVALLVLSSGCNLFDEQKWMQLADSSLQDSGVDAEAGVPFRVADRCDDSLPVLGVRSLRFVVDTTELADDFNQVAACTGFDERGNDGFFAVDMRAGERWHFHLKSMTASLNPAVYVLPSCDERACMPGAGLDECGAGRDEHMTFIAPATRRYIVAVDSRAPGGGLVEVTALHPVCGNGELEHSENCDDGNTDSGDGCDSMCRTEISPPIATEVEPNDDPISANVLTGTRSVEPMVVRGRLGGRCDYDTVAVPVHANGSIFFSLRDSSGMPCGAGVPEMEIVMLDTDGRTPLGRVTSPPALGCPSIGGETFANNLPGGTYFLRYSIISDDSVSFDYQFHVRTYP